MSLIVLLGGARSGKSSFAVDYGRRVGGAVTYVATAQPLDDDMADRIAHHRAERPGDWSTIEEPVDLAGAIRRSVGTVIVDCLTLWTSNLMADGCDDAAIERMASDVAATAGEHDGTVLAISNEVGLGVHPETALGRRYRDVLGRVNQTMVAASGSSLFLVAGRAVPLDDPWSHLPGPP